MPIQASLQLLPTVDAIIAGEVREWESATYAQDVVYAGRKKGFMTVGRVGGQVGPSRAGP